MLVGELGVSAQEQALTTRTEEETGRAAKRARACGIASGHATVRVRAAMAFPLPVSLLFAGAALGGFFGFFGIF
jgi:hypothetical protein